MEKPAAQGSNQRGLVRVDAQILFDYNLAGETPEIVRCQTEQEVADAVDAYIAKPPTEAVSGGMMGQDNEMMATLRPWMMKLEWVMAMMLKAQARMNPASLMMPRLTEVNISGGGLGFRTEQTFKEKDHLEVRFILPPFTQISAEVEIVRIIPPPEGSTGSFLATGFSAILPEDRERVIRFVTRLQSEQLRNRRASKILKV